MMLLDVICLLVNFFGIVDDEIIKDVVCELDYWFLVLVSVVIFLKYVWGLLLNFGWKDYLEKYEFC